MPYNTDMEKKHFTPGCSGFTWQSTDNLHFLGRTYDMFGTLDANRITLIAPGFDLDTSPSGRGDRIRLDYGFIGNAIQGAPSPIFTDGINEKGLMGTLQNFPSFGHYDTQKGEGIRDLHPAFFLPYMLGLCSCVDELCERVRKINLTSEPVFNAHMSVHYMFSDGSGESVIIELDESGISVHRRTIGVMTNAPGYMWHHDNLKNYVAVSNIHTPPRSLLGESVSTFGSGTGGSFGLPGSFSSPDRFVRLAFAKDFSPLGKNEEDAVNRMFSIFSTVTVPDGMLRESAESDDCEKTLCTCVMCSESRTYYFSPFENRRISAYSLTNALSRMKDGEKIRLYPLPLICDIDHVF